MSSLIRLLLSTLSALPMANPANAEPPEPVFWEKAGEWTVYVATNEDTTFDVCFTTKELANDEMIVFYTDGTTATAGLFPTRWQLDERNIYHVDIQVDNGTRIQTTAIASEDHQSVLFEVNLTPYILEFSGGKKFHLHTAAGTVSYDISGSREAFLSMAYCALENRPDMQAILSK